MERSHLGRIPPVEDGWKQVSQFENDEQVWMLYKKPQAHTDEWTTYKLVAKGRAKKKANYWLVKNHKTGAVGFANDFLLLQQYRPNLYKFVNQYFESILV
jgi:hypothetical protein